MALRTIQLRLVVPKKPEKNQQTLALWATHDTINRAAGYYEQQMVLIRQREYETENGIVSAAEVSVELARLVRAASPLGKAPTGDDLNEACTLLRELYEHIVPSTIDGGKGSAQDAGAYIGPLFDSKSKGFLGVFEKLARHRPNWLGDLDGRRERFLVAGNAWKSTTEGEARTKKAGANSRWLKEADKGSKSWPADFLSHAKKRQKQDGTPIPNWVSGLNYIGADLVDAAETCTPTGIEWTSDTFS